VQQQVKKADFTSLKLTQYLVRLKYDDVEKVPKKRRTFKKGGKGPKKTASKKNEEW
jgi:hypothetical protein